MDSVAWAAGEQPVVGVVDTDADPSGEEGDRRVADSLEDLLAEYDGTVVTGSVETVRGAAPSFVVVIGDEALFDVTQTDAVTEFPVLPVDCWAGIDAVSRGALPDAVGTVLAGEAAESQHPMIGVDIGDGTPHRALFDVTLVTDEPARISEYGIASRDDSIVAQFRADGVVVATPAGSHGYANAVDGPILSSAVDAVVVAPIAPFDTHTDRWVLPDDGLSLSIERNEDAVSVSVDGRTLETIAADRRVEISADGSLSTLAIPDENNLE